MKKLSLIVVVSVLMIQAGCQKEEPQAPQLVYPADSAKFDKLPVTLVWNSSPVSDRYILRFYITVGLHRDTFFGYSPQDTCYEITDEQFTCPSAFDFSWSVATVFDSVELWSETRMFTVDRGIRGPRLISPVDSAVFDTAPPAFIWNSDTLAGGYMLNITNLSDSLIIFKTSEDTIYEMPEDSFKIFMDGNYLWWVTQAVNGWILSSETRALFIRHPGEPGEPQQILPVDGDTFWAIPPVFEWSSDSLAKSCVIRIDNATETILEDTLKDTTYSIQNQCYYSLENGVYSWKVANLSYSGKLYWSNQRSFTVSHPADLDTTYFPLGVGYEWSFKRHEWGDGNYGSSWSYDTSYTFTIVATDSFCRGDTLFLCFIQKMREGLDLMGFALVCGI